MRSRSSGVGARSHKALLADPMVDAATIEALAKKHPQVAILHPNCPVELWWKLARSFPLEAIRSPLHPLMLMEEPERWVEMELARAESWRQDSKSKLSMRDAQLFAADCAEHVLSIFEKSHRDDPRPRHAIKAARAFANGKLSLESLNEAMKGADQAERLATQAHQNRIVLSAGPAHAAFAAFHAANSSHGTFLAACDDAGNAIYESERSREGKDGAAVAWKAEMVWQWRRLVEYLQGEA